MNATENWIKTFRPKVLSAQSKWEKMYILTKRKRVNKRKAQNEMRNSDECSSFSSCLLHACLRENKHDIRWKKEKKNDYIHMNEKKYRTNSKKKNCSIMKFRSGRKKSAFSGTTAVFVIKNVANRFLEWYIRTCLCERERCICSCDC